MQPNYTTTNIAVNAVIFTTKDTELLVFLTNREKDPYKSAWELPGGLLSGEETAEQTLQRKVTETTGVDANYFEQFHTFTKPTRDPRGRIIAVASIALIPPTTHPKTGQWFSTQKLPACAFDHTEIITAAVQHIKQHASPNILKHCLPAQFPLNTLQTSYEAITQEKYDNRNFRKMILGSGIVKETGTLEVRVSHRPAKMYAFVDKRLR